jgi:hypothetical protein
VAAGEGVEPEQVRRHDPEVQQPGSRPQVDLAPPERRALLVGDLLRPGEDRAALPDAHLLVQVPPVVGAGERRRRVGRARGGVAQPDQRSVGPRAPVDEERRLGEVEPVGGRVARVERPADVVRAEAGDVLGDLAPARRLAGGPGPHVLDHVEGPVELRGQSHAVGPGQLALGHPVIDRVDVVAVAVPAERRTVADRVAEPRAGRRRRRLVVPGRGGVAAGQQGQPDGHDAEAEPEPPAARASMSTARGHVVPPVVMRPSPHCRPGPYATRDARSHLAYPSGPGQLIITLSCVKRLVRL